MAQGRLKNIIPEHVTSSNSHAFMTVIDIYDHMFTKSQQVPVLVKTQASLLPSPCPPAAGLWFLDLHPTAFQVPNLHHSKLRFHMVPPCLKKGSKNWASNFGPDGPQRIEANRDTLLT